MENENEETIIDSEETNEEVTEEDSDESESKEGEPEKKTETPEAKKARLERQLKRVNKELGIETEPSKPKKKEEEKAFSLGEMDIIALSKADLHDDDMKEVIDYAKYKGISIQEAITSPVVKATVERNVEHRKTADASNTKNARKGAKAVTGEELMSKASQGEFPEPGSKEAEDLFWARRRKARVKNNIGG